MEMLAIAFIILLNGVLSALVAYVAAQRNRSAAAFFWLSFLASFLVGILVLIALPSGGGQEHSSYLACPHCDEKASKNAKICPHCRLEVGGHFQKIKAQEEKSLAERRKTLQDEEIAASKRAQFEAAARRELTRQLLRNPIAWVIAGSLALGATAAVSFHLIEQERISKLLFPDCRVIEESVEITFNQAVEVKFSLPEECGGSIRSAMSEELTSLSAGVGMVRLDFFLDEKPLETLWVGQNTTISDYAKKIPNQDFFDYATEFKRSAERVKVELTYESELQVTEKVSVEQLIPKTIPAVQLKRGKMSTNRYGEKNFFTVVLEFSTFQVADSITYDWPGTEKDQTQKLTRGYEYGVVSGMLGNAFTSSTLESAEVVIKVVHDDVIVQTLRVASE